MRILTIHYAVPEDVAKRWAKSGVLMREFPDLNIMRDGKVRTLKMFDGALLPHHVTRQEVDKARKLIDERSTHRG